MMHGGKEKNDSENLSSSMQLLMCYIPTQHRVLASSLTTLSRISANKLKINPENPVSPTFENIIHQSKMATSTSAKVKFPDRKSVV